jgi:lipopolysaccharide assembly protein B
MPTLAATDLLWLLLPVAAASGWWVARYDQRRHRHRASRDLPTAYFKGLNFLLNEQPDKAIEVFIKVLEEDAGTVETHLALGNLFRRRGEVERAIRVHQNLIARPALDKKQRSQALLELGQDYLKAGLFDRAENLFLELAEIRLHAEQALRLLVQIYQQEKEWGKAIATSRKLARAAGKSQDPVIAQYYCEQAEQAILDKNFAMARQYVAAALGCDKACVRGSIQLGRIEAGEGRQREAIKAWKRVEQQDPLYLGEVANTIAVSYRSLNDEAGLYDYFSGVLQRHADVSVMLALADIVKNRDGVDAAEDFVATWLRKQPSVHGLHRLIQLNIADADAATRADLVLLCGIIERLMEQQSGYSCQQCGFRGKTLHWQCPGCQRWNTIKPLLNMTENPEEGKRYV